MEFKTFESSLLFEQFSGDEEILLEVIDIFHAAQADLLVGIKEGIETKDAEKLRINAHTMKGVLGNFYAKAGAGLAYELELCGKKKEFAQAEKLFYSLETFVKTFMAEIAVLKSNLISPK